MNITTKEDIETLIRNAVPEGKELDYKKQLSLDIDKDKGEFLADICSFANTSGGTMVVGISDNDGKPGELVGINTEEDDDQFKQRMEEILLNGLEPKCKISPYFIEVGGKKILAINIEKGWLQPHRVKFTGYQKNTGQFYMRNSAGKFQMDVEQLRHAFTNTTQITEKILEFKKERLFKISNKELPYPLIEGGAKIAVHVIPLESFRAPQIIDTQKLQEKGKEILHPYYTEAKSWTINLNGFITFSAPRNENARSYVQIYRNGIIEIVDASILQPREEAKTFNNALLHEKGLTKTLQSCLKFYNEIKMSPPINISISFLGVKGYTMEMPNSLCEYPSKPKIEITENNIILPDQLIENIEDEAIKNLDQSLKPVFDIIWNACGFEGSKNYDENGKLRIQS